MNRQASRKFYTLSTKSSIYMGHSSVYKTGSLWTRPNHRVGYMGNNISPIWRCFSDLVSLGWHWRLNILTNLFWTGGSWLGSISNEVLHTFIACLATAPHGTFPASPLSPVVTVLATFGLESRTVDDWPQTIFHISQFVHFGKSLEGTLLLKG